jgi:segregation and condensation protein A
MQELNLDVAGEFLVMAATLIHIKSRMLLPRPDPTQEDPEEDPREALVRRLLEHQKFKAAAELLHERETMRSAQWTRADGPIAEIAGEAPEPEIEVDLFSLISAFRAVVERAKQRPKMYLPGEQMPIEDRIEQLLVRLSETDACGFEDLFADVQTRAGLIVTFLALLEMIRLKLVRVFQTGAMGPIRVYKRARPSDAPKPILDPEARHAHEIEAQYPVEPDGAFGPHDEHEAKKDTKT